MVLSSHQRITSEVIYDARDFTDFSRRDNRELLVELFNQIAGMLSYPMRMLQDEFIQDRMEPGEVMAFVEMCKELVAAASSAGLAFGYPS